MLKEKWEKVRLHEIYSMPILQRLGKGTDTVVFAM